MIELRLKQMLSAAMTVFLAVTGMPFASAMTRDELRAAYADIVADAGEETVFETEPDPEVFTTAGQLTRGKIENALAYVNFLRSIAGLDSVEYDELYGMRAQHAACLLAANDAVSHSPGRCEAIPDAMYETAYAGAGASCLAKLDWQHPEILLEGISYFARDDGENNAGVLAHRRWLLDPAMRKTGFGLAYSKSGASYIAMYAIDGAGSSVQWDHTAWPAEGIFPAELMREGLAWSVTLSSDIYDSDRSQPVVTLLEETTGTVYEFEGQKCQKDTGAYGSGWCLSFTPDLKTGEISAYQQNQVWRVQIGGLVKTDGSEASLEWECDMVSLTYQAAVNIEITPRKANIKVGETMQLNAEVVPAWADDLSAVWESSDPAVAEVGEDGTVHALSKGTCEIRCTGENGIEDVCTLRVG